MQKKESPIRFWITNLVVVSGTIGICYGVLEIIVLFQLVNPEDFLNLRGFIEFLLFGIAAGLIRIIWKNKIDNNGLNNKDGQLEKNNNALKEEVTQLKEKAELLEEDYNVREKEVEQLKERNNELNSEINKLKENNKKAETTNRSDDDISLLEMVINAFNEKQYREVIRIGSAVSDVLWYSGRKSLRIKIGTYLEQAAKWEKDYYQQARANIEDIGNTYIEMPEEDSVKKSINNIKYGMRIAQENGYYDLVARGYRNLACAYCFRYHESENPNYNDLVNAESSIATGIEYSQKIGNEYFKKDAIASLEYAAYRACHIKGDNKSACEHLETAKGIYEEIINKDPSKETIVKDRLKKIYRSLGEGYLLSEDEDLISKGEDLVLQAFNQSEGDRDYTNMIRCGTIYIKFKKLTDPASKPIKDKCDKVINYLPENDRFRKKYLDVINKYGNK